MKFNQNRIKKRRQERIRRLRQRMERTGIDDRYQEEPVTPTFSRYLSDNWDAPPWETDGPAEPMKRLSYPQQKRYKWMLQIVISLLLFSLVYLVFQIQSPLTQSTRQFVTEVMNRPFNFDGLAYWYEKTFGERPSLLPALARNEQTAETGPPEFVPPLKGTVISPFYRDGQGILLGADDSGRVSAIDEGWVTFVGQKEELGLTVIIRHQQGVESWYAHLDQALVQQNDWVQPGQMIATLPTEKDQRTLYFAVKKDHRFINPVEVISFE
ncbi:MAG: M23 family metallopeptidase [Bacillaceae bacterium]|nr:M23 family metallopeptidase [Bacillaceae bacterium]